MGWKTIDSAPKDVPIIVWYDHEQDSYYDREDGKLTDYGANAEGGDFLSGSGIVIAKWSDGYYESDGIMTDSYYVPPCWAVYLDGDCTDTVCNPTHWIPLPTPPEI